MLLERITRDAAKRKRRKLTPQASEKPPVDWIHAAVNPLLWRHHDLNPASSSFAYWGDKSVTIGKSVHPSCIHVNHKCMA